jgi:hypothetical protein
LLLATGLDFAISSRIGLCR